MRADNSPRPPTDDLAASEPTADEPNATDPDAAKQAAPAPNVSEPGGAPDKFPDARVMQQIVGTDTDGAPAIIRAAEKTTDETETESVSDEKSGGGRQDELDSEAENALFYDDQDRLEELIEDGAADPRKRVPEPEKRVEEFPPLDELDPLGLETTETVGEDEQERPLTVQELAVRELLDEYEDGIDGGDIGKEDARYKFYYAVQAGADLEGREIFGTVEDSTSSTIGSISREKDQPAEATPEDMAAIIDEEAVESTLKDIGENEEEINADLEKKTKEALEKVEDFDPEAMRSDLKEAILSDDFRHHVDTLTADGKQEESNIAMSRALSNYALLTSPEEAEELGVTASVKGSVERLDGLLQNPDAIEDRYWDDTGRQLVTLLSGELKQSIPGLTIPREISKFVNDPQLKGIFKAPDVQKELGQVLMRYSMAGSDLPAKEKALDDSIRIMNERDAIPQNERNAVIKLLKDLTRTQVFSTAAGALGLGTALTSLTGGTGTGDDPVENLAVASGFLVLAANTEDIASAGIQIKDKLSQYKGLDKVLGFGNLGNLIETKSLKDLYEADFDPVKHRYPQIDTKGGLWNNGRLQKGAEWINSRLPGAIDAGERAGVAAAKVIESTGLTGLGLSVLGSGIAGLITEKNASAGKIGANSLLIGSGTLMTGAGGAYLGKVFAQSDKAAETGRIWLNRLLLSGIGVGVIATIVDQVTGNEAKVTKDQRKYFTGLGEAGLTKEGSPEKIEFLVESFYDAGEENVNLPEEGLVKQDTSARPETEEGETIFDAYDWERYVELENENDYHLKDFGDDMFEYGFLKDEHEALNRGEWPDPEEEKRNSSKFEELDEDTLESLPTWESGVESSSAGEFEEDAHLVDVATIHRDRDEEDYDVVYFKKHGEWQKHRREDNEEIFERLVDLHDLARPDGEFDEEIARDIDKKFADGDKHNEIEDLKAELGLSGDSQADDLESDIGDFIERVERIDIDTIDDSLDYGRVSFVKNGERQVIDPNVGSEVNQEAANYLKDLLEVASPDGELDKEIANWMEARFEDNDESNDEEVIEKMVKEEFGT